MPRIRWIARAIGIALALSAAAGGAMAQDPQPKPKPSPRRVDPEAKAPPRRGDGDGDRPERGPRPKAAPPSRALGNDPAESSVSGLRDMLIGGIAGQPVGVSSILLPMAPIQKELKLDAKQKAKVLEITRTIAQQKREMWRTASATSVLIDPEEMREATAALQQESEGVVARILKPEQRRRLAQIALQIEGTLAVARPDVAQKLSLSQAQMANIEAILEERQAALETMKTARSQYFAASRAGELGADKANRDMLMAQARRMQEKSERINDQAVQQISRILNKKQRATFEKLLGEPFDLAQLEANRPAAAGDGERPARPERKRPAPRAVDRDQEKAVDGEPEKDMDAPRPKAERPRAPSRKTVKEPADDTDR